MNKPYKSILFISDGYNSPYPGNYIPSLQALENALKNDGYNVIYTMDNKAKKRNWCLRMVEAGSKIEFFDFQSKKFNTLIKLYKLIKKEKVQIVHKHFGNNIIPLVLSWLLPHVVFLSHIHSDWSYGNENAYKKSAKQKLFDKLSYRIGKLTVSQKLAEVESGTYVPNRLVLSRRVTLTQDMRMEMRDKLGIPKSKMLLLVLGWSPEVKGVDLAVKAVKELRDDGNDLELAIVRGERIEVVTDFISQKCGITNADYIHIIPPTQNVFEYYGMADIMLCTSRSEGFEYSLLENLSIGKPTIASLISGHNWAKEFQSVEFFESQNVEALKKAILNINKKINDEEYSARLNRDVQIIEQSYGIDDWIERLSNVYNHLLNKA